MISVWFSFIGNSLESPLAAQWFLHGLSAFLSQLCVICRVSWRFFFFYSGFVHLHHRVHKSNNGACANARERCFLNISKKNFFSMWIENRRQIRKIGFCPSDPNPPSSDLASVRAFRFLWTFLLFWVLFFKLVSFSLLKEISSKKYIVVRHSHAHTHTQALNNEFYFYFACTEIFLVSRTFA